MTILSASENDFVFDNLVSDPQYWVTNAPISSNQAVGPWIGALQPEGSAEPADGWQWLNGDGLLSDTYENWLPLEPNNASVPPLNEDRALFFENNTRDSARVSSRWSDLPGTSMAPSYVVEFEERPEPTTQEINVIVRDFLDSHPNMQIPLTFNVFEIERGILQPTLGNDRKPVFNAQRGPFKTVTNAEDFDQWYRDVEGVNSAGVLTMSFDRLDDGGLLYVDEAFFPIDDFLFGNQGRVHNFHYTLELHGEFTYSAGDSVIFTGDDDFWLFVDNKLVLDVGGVHDRLTGQANLDNFDLQVGKVYPIDIFFAERHTSESRFVLETSFIFEQIPGDIDGDGQRSIEDLDFLCEGVAFEDQYRGFDLSGDGFVDAADIRKFLTIANSLEGDVDLNGHVEFSDFLILSANFGMFNVSYGQGDVNCDFQISFEDFLILSSQFGQSAPARMAAVPEPHTPLTIIWSLGLMMHHVSCRLLGKP